MAANNFGLKVGVDGEAEFKKALRELNQSMKTLGTEAKLVASEFDANDKSVERYAAESRVLNKQIDEQQKKVALLREALESAKKNYGENSTQAQKYQQQLNKAQTELNEFNRKLKATNEAMQQAAETSDDAAENTKEYADAVDDASNAGGNLQNTSMKIGKAFAVVSAAAVTAASAVVKAVADITKAFVTFTSDAAEYSDAVLTESEATGIATDRLQEYMYAAELVDVSTETLTSSMARNIRSMKTAASGTGEAAEAYAKLGVQITNSNGKLRDGQDVYWDLVDALGKVENETERDALAMTLLGRSAQDLNPLIKAGSERMKELGSEAQQAGYVLSGDTLQAFGDYDDATKRLANGATAAKNALGTVLLPVLESLANDGTDLIGQFTNGVLAADGDVNKIGEVIGNLLPEIVGIISEYVPAFLDVITDLIASAIKVVAASIPELLGTVGDVVNDVIGLLLDEETLTKVITAATALIFRVVNTILDNLPAILQVAIDLVNALGEGIADALPELMPKIVLVIVEIVKTLLNNIDQIIMVAGDIIVALVEGILEALPKLVEAAPEIIQALVIGITKAIVQLFNVGKKLIEGLWEGIKSAGPALWENIKNFCGNIVDWFKDAFGIHSPSTVFAGIGSFMAEGLGEGFTDEMNGIAQEMVSAVPTSFEAAQIVNGSVSSGSGGVSGEELALMREQNDLLRLILEKNPNVLIGDEEIGAASVRYNQSLGLVFNT